MCVTNFVKAVRREIRVAIIRANPNLTRTQKEALVAFERVDWNGVWTYLRRR